MLNDYSRLAREFVTMDALLWLVRGVAESSRTCAAEILSSLRGCAARRQNGEHDCHES
jgi:hypothetical protein